jgi:hypothetical protein
VARLVLTANLPAGVDPPAIRGPLVIVEISPVEQKIDADTNVRNWRRAVVDGQA